MLFDRQGKVRGKVIRNYTLDTPAVGWIELDPEIYWNAVVEGFREVLQTSGVDPKAVRTVSGCSQGETVIFLDAADRPVRPAMVWLDTRARDEVEELSRIVSDEELYRVTGLSNVDPTWSAAKILWVKKNQPEVFRKTAKFLLVEDYITYRLTGRFTGTPNLLSSTMFVDVHTGRYWPKIVDAVGVAGRLPEIVASGIRGGDPHRFLRRGRGAAAGDHGGEGGHGPGHQRRGRGELPSRHHHRDHGIGHGHRGDHTPRGPVGAGGPALPAPHRRWRLPHPALRADRGQRVQVVPRLVLPGGDQVWPAAWSRPTAP